MKNLKTFEDLNEMFGGKPNNIKPESFKYIEKTTGKSERLLVETYKDVLYVKQGGAKEYGGEEVFMNKEQAKELVLLLQKFIDGK